MDDIAPIVVFSDGACIGNPGPGGYGAIVKINDKITELGGFEKHTTNNRMEMTAALKALEFIPATTEKIEFYTDSQYLINGITKWIHGWIKKNWVKGEGEVVLNRDIWEALHREIVAKKFKIHWHYVRGHVGIAANERVDAIATTYAAQKKISLYKGGFAHYSVSLKASPEDNALKKSPSTKKSAKALGYVSVVKGELKTHKTWPECEARVKGTSGAKFKKFVTMTEKEEILKSWGLKK